MSRPILCEAKGLCVAYGKGRTRVQAVRGVDLAIHEGESVGLVGESGSGKSSLGRALLRLEPVEAGRVLFEGTDIAGLCGAALRRFRQRAQIIFQDPFGSLNPRLTIGAAIEEVLRVHRVVSPPMRQDRLEALLKQVGLPEDSARRYPHEFSGGQRQRAAIARALALNPVFLVADEALSALDVSVQAQIVELLMELKRSTGLTYLFIAHDLAVVRDLCDRVIVLREGIVVEEGSTETLYSRPRHPYTLALLEAVPDVERSLRKRHKRDL